jgi:hypothetical protein
VFAPAKVETEVPNAPQIDFHPGSQIEIFRPGIARIFHGVSPINLPELFWIDRFRDAGGVEAERRPAKKNLFRMTPGARKSVACEDLVEFVRQPHKRNLFPAGRASGSVRLSC